MFAIPLVFYAAIFLGSYFSSSSVFERPDPVLPFYPAYRFDVLTLLYFCTSLLCYRVTLSFRDFAIS